MNRLSNKQLQIIRVLSFLLTGVPQSKSVAWGEIVAAIRNEKIEVKNWLTEVRGPLQACITTGAIKRCPEVTEERYFDPRVKPSLDSKSEALKQPSKAAEALKVTFSPIQRGDGTVTGYMEMFYVSSAERWVTIPGVSRFIEAKAVDASLATLLLREVR